MPVDQGSREMMGKPANKSRKTAKAKSQLALSKASYQAMAEFRFAIRKFMAFSEAAANAAGLKPQQHQALLAIKGAPGRNALSVGEIAERLLVRHHTAVELVDRLTDLDLVVRNPDPKDGRRILVSLTEKGDEIIDKLSAIHLQELHNVRPTMKELLHQFERRLSGARRRD